MPQERSEECLLLFGTLSLASVNTHFSERTLGELRAKCPKALTLQPEIIAKLILKTFFHVTEMRFVDKIIPKQFFHVVL